MTDFSYDQVEYPCYPFSQTHPDRMATIATLLGMTAAPIEHCRVLELGCGNVQSAQASSPAMSQSSPSDPGVFARTDNRDIQLGRS